MTSYEDIFKRFLRKVSDVRLAQTIEFNPDRAMEDMTGWLHSAVAKIGSLSEDQITFDDENKNIAEDLSDFEIELYALGMRVEWLEQYVERTESMLQLIGGKEEKFTSQAAHLKQLQDLRAQDKLTIRKLIRDYGYHHNDYIDGQ